MRYLRYEINRQLLNEDQSDNVRTEFETAKRMFVQLIQKWWKRQEDFDGNLVLNPLLIRKGLDPTNSRVEFADGTVWVIPPEIKRQVLDLE